MAIKNATKILKKYSAGVGYLESEWKGNDALTPGKMFKGDEENGGKERKTYECLSSELILNGAFRQMTKGIET